MALEIQEARAQEVHLTEDALVIDLVDGRTITVPLARVPRLWYGSTEERANLEIIGDGKYIHWPDLDEDLSVVGVIAGCHSGESAESLKRWPASREIARKSIGA